MLCTIGDEVATRILERELVDLAIGRRVVGASGWASPTNVVSTLNGIGPSRPTAVAAAKPEVEVRYFLPRAFDGEASGACADIAEPAADVLSSTLDNMALSRSTVERSSTTVASAPAKRPAAPCCCSSAASRTVMRS